MKKYKACHEMECANCKIILVSAVYVIAKQAQQTAKCKASWCWDCKAILSNGVG